MAPQLPDSDSEQGQPLGTVLVALGDPLRKVTAPASALLVSPVVLPPNPCLARDGWEDFRSVETFKSEYLYFLLKFFFNEKHQVSFALAVSQVVVFIAFT